MQNREENTVVSFATDGCVLEMDLQTQIAFHSLGLVIH